MRAYSRSKKKSDQWLGKDCILGRTLAGLGIGEQVWFVLNTVGGFGEVAIPENFATFTLNQVWKEYFQHLNWQTIYI